MARPGRPALPTNVHLLNGNSSKLSAADLNGQSGPAVAVPTCPAFLGSAARTEWVRIAPHLKAAGLVTHLDRAALAGYCQAWGEWAELCERTKALMGEVDASTGQPRGPEALVERTPSGYKQVSALAQARDRAFDRMMRTAKEFGLSAASRVGANAQQPQLPGMPVDPMEGFLQASANIPAAAG